MKSKILIISLSVALAISLGGNLYQHRAKNRSEELVSALQTDITSKERQITDLQSTADTYASQKEKYWRLRVDDYLITLQEGSTENSLDLIYTKDDIEKTLMSFQAESDYQVPEDISAEAFEDCLGHAGFRLYKRRPLGSSYHYYEVDYYAMKDELTLLAYRWGSKDGDVYEVDIDGDGVKELICNVTWMADGAQGVLIYHYDGDNVLSGHGSDLLDEPADIHGVGSIFSQYNPSENKVYINYWKDSLNGFREKSYDIDLNRIEMYKTFK